MQFSAPTKLPFGKAGQMPEGVQDYVIRAMTNLAGGSPLKIELDVGLPTAPDPAECLTCTGSKNGTMVVTFSGGCCVPALTCEVCFPETLPTDQDEWLKFLMCALNGCPRTAGFGQWKICDGVLTFVAYDPNVGFGVDIQVPSNNLDVTATVTPSQPMGLDFCPGVAVFVDPSATYPYDDECSTPWDVPVLPTEDVNIAGAKQKWAGIVADCPDHENAPVLNMGSGIGANCVAPQCMPRKRCVRVLSEGSILISLEKPWDFVADGCPPLLYRYEADGDLNQLGAFSFAAGAGLAEVPATYSIVRVLENGLVHIRLK